MIPSTVELTTTETHDLLTQRRAVPVADAVFELDGPGAVDCMQGMFTNDVVRPGPKSLVWGALLTPKGMIVTDAWVRRDGARIRLIVPAAARTATHDLLRRSVPPRLAGIADRSDSAVVRWLIGRGPGPLIGVDIVEPDGPAPFAALAVTTDPASTDAQLHDAGWLVARPAFADAEKLRLGWPTLGREIDDRTLPQEVRFDELGGVKYDKGCYTGQETVARLHFRGHANRLLRAIRWAPGAGPDHRTVSAGSKEIGTLRSTGRLGETTLALAVLRREAAIGDTVTAGGAEAAIVELPVALGPLAVA